MANPNPVPLPHGLTFETVDSTTIEDWYLFSTNIFNAPPADGTAPFLSCFYPNGLSPEIVAWALDAHIKAVPNPDQHYALVRDPSQPNSPIVAAARWCEVPRTTAASRAEAEAEHAKEREEDAKNPIPGVAYDTLEIWRPAQEGGQSRVVGDRAHVYLKILAVREDWQGKGIGKALLRHICESAGEKGMPVYLESSTAGVPVYLKVGFEDKGYIDWDAKRLGHDKSFKHLAMIWEPKGVVNGA